jgi:hypothetical protein
MRRILLLMLCLGGLFAGPRRSPADTVNSSLSALQIELQELAKSLHALVVENGEGSISVGAFASHKDVDGSAGPQLQLILARELQGLGLAIDEENPRYRVHGEYGPFNADRKLGIRVSAHLIDGTTGKTWTGSPLMRGVFGRETTPLVLGLTVADSTALPTVYQLGWSDLPWDRRLGFSPPLVTGATIRGRSGSAYAVEVLAKRDGQLVSQTATIQDNRPWVELAAEDSFAVRLVNESEHEAAVRLTVDGVEALEFSGSNSLHWIVPPGRSLVVDGWRLPGGRTEAFQARGGFPQSPAAPCRLTPSPATGQISASFSACWKDDAARPRDEPPTRDRLIGVGSDVETSDSQRQLGRLRSVISVRFERARPN